MESSSIFQGWLPHFKNLAACFSLPPKGQHQGKSVQSRSGSVQRGKPGTVHWDRAEVSSALSEKGAPIRETLETDMLLNLVPTLTLKAKYQNSIKNYKTFSQACLLRTYRPPHRMHHKEPPL